MKFSIQQIAMLIGWLAFLFGLLCLVRVEAHRMQWTSQVPSGAILITNFVISIFAVLTAVATVPDKRWFWIGFSIVAASLTICQLASVTVPGVATNAAFLVESIFLPPQQGGAASLFRGGHMSQLETIMTYGWTPLFAWLGGWYTQRVEHQRKTD
ncbi:MAG: hypothetical protein AAFN77_14535 [Planctomycetota bacterium]